MRAKGFNGYGDLELVNIPKPQISDGRVLVRVTAAGVTPLDHTILSGQYPKAKAPLVLGNEGAGVVVDGGGSEFPTGSRVVFTGLYGVAEDGTYSEWLAVRKQNLCLIPEGIDDVNAAGVPVAYLTAQIALGLAGELARRLGLRVPEDVAVVGSDDTDLSLASEPTLTSVLLNLERIGFEGMSVLMKLIAGEPRPAPTIRLRCADLHVRESTGNRRPEICDIASALTCIQEHACRGITVGEVIRQTQRVSRVTFHRRFLETVGQTPAQAIRERQLQEVRRLLASTELPITMVSELCGFSSAKVFARSFREAEKVTPRDYRKAKSIRRKLRRSAGKR
jgi:AraC-like DNA-binding protein